MNNNKIFTDGFSNPQSYQRYSKNWPGEPDIAKKCLNGFQCGGCGWFATFNEDWGLCHCKRSRHYLETVFEHFTCSKQKEEGWDRAHSLE